MKIRLTTTAKSARAWIPVALLGVLVLSGWAAWTALATSGPPTPTITSSPANPTNATPAPFTYSSPGAIGFLCKLDTAASFTICLTHGITYSGLAPGSHTFQVRSVDSSGHTSSAASYSWVIDSMAPTVSSIVRADASPTNAKLLHWTVTFSEPVKNVAMSNFRLATSNVGGTAPTVTAVAPSGSVPSSTWTVTASTSGATGSNSGSIGLNLTTKPTIQDAAGNAFTKIPAPGQQYTFDTTPPTTSAVSIVRNGASPTNAASLSWTVTFGEAVTGVVATSFSLAASGLSGTPTITAATGSATTRTITASTGTGTPLGSGTLQLNLVLPSQITDLAGNTLAGAPPVGQTYSIDRLAPPVAFTAKPADPSSVSTSQFSWTSGPANDFDRFECATENGSFSTQVPSRGGPPKPCVSQLTYVVATTYDGRHQFDLRAYDHVGNFTQITYSWKVAAGSSRDFSISGNAVGLLYPGAPAQTIALKLTNPSSALIFVTDVRVTVASNSSNSGCDPATNVAVTQSDVSATHPIWIPAGASVTLPTQGVSAPKIRMLNLPTNQDACKNATFSLSYNGSAHS
jgi:hypothetical protein